MLHEVTIAGGWEAWLLYLLNVVEQTSRWTTAKVRAIRNLSLTAAGFVRANAPKIYSRELVDVIFEQPYCRIDNVVSAGIAKRQTASVYLATLVDIGVVTPIQHGREKLFIHRALLDLLTSDAHGRSDYRLPNGFDPVSGPAPTDKILSEESQVNSRSVDEQLRFAIAKRLMIMMVYGGSIRVIEPHDYGVQKGTTRLLAYQRSGRSKTGRKSLSGWRLFDASKIQQCRVLRQTFAGSRGEPDQHHYAWDFVYARVS